MDFFHRYISLVESNDVISSLENQPRATIELVRTLDPDHRYAPGKWSVKEVLGHVIDTERIMSYRALRISRKDPVALPGFDQDVLAASAQFHNQPIEDLIAEFQSVRQSTLYLLRPLTQEMWGEVGSVSGHPITVRALAYITAGHELYHRQLFKERYQ